MHTAVGEKRDGRTDNVDDTHGQGTTLQAVAESHQRVSGLTGLRNENAGIVTEDRGLAIQEVGGKLDADGDLSQLLENTTDSHAGVVAGTAGDEDDSAASADGGEIGSQTTEGHSLVGVVETATHGVDNGLGLLEDLLLHEVVELALHDLLELQLKGLDSADVGAAISLLKAVDVERALVNVGDIIVLKVHDLLGVLHDSGGVRRQEELGGHGHAIVSHESPRLRAVEKRLVGSAQKTAAGREEVGGVLLESHVLRGSLGGESLVLLGVLNVDKVDLHASLGLDANDERRTLAGSDDLVRVVNGLDQQSVSTLKLLDDSLGKVGEANVGVLVVEVLGQLGNALSIGLGLESEALALEQSLEFLVVGNNTIVDNGEFPRRVGASKHS